MSQIITPNHVARGIRAGFHDLYRSRTADLQDEIAELFADFPSDGLFEDYAGYESAPTPRRWIKGMPIPSKAFADFGYQVTNLDWGREVRWHKNDMDDDRTQQLMPRARDLGRRFAELPKRIANQIFTASVDAELLPSSPNAFDGLPLFNATAGRFGLAAGNIRPGTGVAAVSTIHADYFAGIALFRNMRDTEAQPFWSDTDIDGGILILVAPENEELFRKAFEAELVQGTSAAISNIAKGKAKVKVWNRLSGTNDWFIVMTGTEWKPLLRQTRQEVEDNLGDFTNSDLARTQKEFSMQFHSRTGYGIWVPQTAVMINN